MFRFGYIIHNFLVIKYNISWKEDFIEYDKQTFNEI